MHAHQQLFFDQISITRMQHTAEVLCFAGERHELDSRPLQFNLHHRQNSQQAQKVPPLPILLVMPAFNTDGVTQLFGGEGSRV